MKAGAGSGSRFKMSKHRYKKSSQRSSAANKLDSSTLRQARTKRVVIEYVGPQIDGGQIPIKRIVGEKVIVTAHIFSDGHDRIQAELLYRTENEKNFRCSKMTHIVNDEWTGSFEISELKTYYYTVRAWMDRFGTWQEDLSKKAAAGQNVKVDLMIGSELLRQTIGKAGRTDASRLRQMAKILRQNPGSKKVIKIALSEKLTDLVDKYPDKSSATEYPSKLAVSVSRPKALFSSWYELFPRSCGLQGKHGTFADCERLLPEIRKLGFDVLYLPPIHPIGKTHRKGKNNSQDCGPGDPGSPWAIGSANGGHKSIAPELGTIKDFRNLIQHAKEHGIEIALDLAFQCSPDHPYVKEHPEWFRWRPDKTVQYAENPPKKYEDILPLNFETNNWKDLWLELKSIVVFWIKQGVRIFRMDNPHTKPFAFWQWLISEIRKKYPEVIFLSEAFTRPKVMQRLAKLGFDQSYTYFTWRNTKFELQEYLTELTQTEVCEYLRPNFWPNTPDILPQFLQYGGRAAFIIRLVLAATLSSNYGIYGPAFELCISEALEGKEEYSNSEKYEIKHWDRNQAGNIRAVIERVNLARLDNPSLQQTRNLKFYEIDNNMMIAYGKTTDDLSNRTIMIVNLDPYHKQSGWLNLPLEELGIDPSQPYLLHDILSNDKYTWQGSRNYLELDPRVMPAHILKVHKHLRHEQDFDYFT
jgi:starch synthase (maltosyl-transferring)